ncbi:MAG: hypothetical protein RR415_10375 [Ruthenibacterium sp.]
MADAELGDKEKLLTDQIKLNITREQYLRFSRAAGLPTQNERAQVAGFGRSEASKASAAYRKNTANNKAYSDREFSIKAVTEESIEAVPKISGSAFTTEQIDNLQSANRAVLRAIIDKKIGIEAGVYLDKNMQPIGEIVVGQISKLEISPTPDKARAMIHNHPSGETFSLKDISTFTIDEKLDILEIVGNNGSLYLIEKGEDYDFVAVRKRWIKATDDYNNCDQSNKRKIEISEEFLNDSRKFGLNYKIFRRE